MKRLITAIAIVSLFLFSCGKKKQTAEKLKKDTPAYELAEQISAKLPQYSPEKNKVLATTKYFEYTTADAFKKFQALAGKQTNRIAGLDTARLKMQMNQLINNLVETKLLSVLADKAGITVEKSEVDSLISMQYNRSGGEEKFKQQLAQQNVKMSDIRESIKTSIKIQKYIDEMTGKDIEPTEKEIMDYYAENYKDVETVAARHILIKAQNNEKEAQQEIKEIKNKIEEGADFAEMAKKHSEGPSSKKGGDLGEFSHGEMVPSFERVAFNLEPGEVSDPVKTRFGYHIIKVYDKKTESQPLEEVKNQIIQQLKTKNKQSSVRDFIEKKKEEANLEYHI